MQDQQNLMKPFGFCCDINNQDPETHYDARNPPFESSLTDVIQQRDGPDLKFRILDSKRLRRGLGSKHSRGGFSNHEELSPGKEYLGENKRCRGPMRWYLEDEIDLARDMLFRERQAKNEIETKRNIKIAKQKEKADKRRRGTITKDNGVNGKTEN